IVETQGIVLVEALRCGLPLVTTDCGGPADLGLSPADGTLITVPTAENLAAAILAWAAKGRPSLPDRKARHLRYSKRFSRKVIQQRLFSIYHEATSAQNSPD
ncbi:MAG: glycosyltransferase, partial [Bacteroidota bacterium]